MFSIGLTSLTCPYGRRQGGGRAAMPPLPVVVDPQIVQLLIEGRGNDN